MGSTCWILLKSWKKEYSFSKFHDRYFYLVVVAMVQCLCWCCYFYHLDSFYFCFFLCKAFLRNEILNCFQSANDDNNSKAFFLFFGTPSLLFRMTIASTMVFLFISQSFSLYPFICNQQNGERLLFHCRCTWISLLYKVLETKRKWKTRLFSWRT